MNKTLSKLAICGIFVLPLAGGLVSMGTAYADEHEMRHWNYDDRHHHAHYYPAFGYRIGVLPPGYLALGFGGRRLFFLAGVWYEPTPAGYVVVRPPVGIITPSLPPDYSTVWVGGVPYYYANDTDYTSQGRAGMSVANPPAAGTSTEAPPALPPAASVPQTPPPAPPTPLRLRHSHPLECGISAHPPMLTIPMWQHARKAGNPCQRLRRVVIEPFE